MSDIQLLWECTTTPSPPQDSRKNTAQQGVRQTLHQLSDSWKQKTRRNAAKRAVKAIK
jgi:hypothetical protein